MNGQEVEVHSAAANARAARCIKGLRDSRYGF